MDVAVLFHVSKKADIKDINRSLKPFLKNLFETSEVNNGQIRVSLSYFSKNHKIVGNFLKFTSKEQYDIAVDKLPKNVRGKQADGGQALKMIRGKVFKHNVGDRPDADNVVLVITDEKTNVKPKVFIEEARGLRQSGVNIVTVGIGKADKVELTSVATDNNTVLVASYDDLKNGSLVDQLRTAIFSRKSV